MGEETHKYKFSGFGNSNSLYWRQKEEREKARSDEEKKLWDELKKDPAELIEE